MAKIYSFSELALAAGRFEMQPTPHQGVLHRESLVGVEDAEKLCLFDASEIRACQPVTRSARHQQLLDALGTRSGSHWILDAPEGDTARSKWARLLRSDQVLMFTAPSEMWLSTIIRQLHSPFVAVLPSMSLTEEWLAFQRDVFSRPGEIANVSLGAGRATFTFVGKGAVFAAAVEQASLRPPLMAGYPYGALRDVRESRDLIFGAGPAVNEV